MKTETPAARADAETFTDPDDDRSTASGPEELNPETTAPEVPPGAGELVTWDEIPAEPEATSGDRIEDEAETSVQLVNEGLEEADRELRMAAADDGPDDEDLSDDAEAAADYPRQGILS